jgi:hypothetical protein
VPGSVVVDMLAFLNFMLEFCWLGWMGRWLEEMGTNLLGNVCAREDEELSSGAIVRGTWRNWLIYNYLSLLDSYGECQCQIPKKTG